MTTYSKSQEKANEVHTDVETAFGTVQIINVKGNLKLQELIDEFAEKLSKL